MTLDLHPVSSPFERVCLFVDDAFHVLTFSRCIMDRGLTVRVFDDVGQIVGYLKENPLEASVFCQTSRNEVFEAIGLVYKGPVFRLSGDRDAMMEQLGRGLRQVCCQLLKCQDPEAFAVLTKINRFLNGHLSPLLAMGSERGLEVALEYLCLFSPRAPTLVSDDAEESSERDAAWWVTTGVFDRPLAWQRTWWGRFKVSTTPHLILQPGSLAEFDRQYDTERFDKRIYDFLSLRAVDVAPLAVYSIEELSVQVPEPENPTIILNLIQGGRERADHLRPMPGEEAPHGGRLRSMVSRILGGPGGWTR